MSAGAQIVVGQQAGGAAVWQPESCKADLPRIVAGGFAGAHAVNSDGTIVGGIAAPALNSDGVPVRWTSTNTLWQIEQLDSRAGTVYGANATGDLAGAVSLPCDLAGGCQRAVIWYAGGGSLELGTLGGAHSWARDIKRDVHACEAILALSGTTNGRLATEGFKTLEKRTGTRLHDLAAEHEGKQITFADTQAAPTPVITSPEWSGSESGGRRYSPFMINVERLKPWHTLTGRQHFYLDHDWMAELGENLPVYRPPLSMGALFGEPEIGSVTELGIAVRYLTPHSKWSIHSEYQDNLFMLSLSRGGQTIWMSDQDAAKVGVADNDWIEAVNRNGVVVARAIVSHRMPEGTVYMYHAQDRLIDVPIAETSGKRGGIHNSLTRLLIKPSHLIGGYAQLSWAFNYIGPTGNQRDEVTVIRRRSQDVEY